VAILDADKEGFLRSTTSLVQTAGRAARNISGKVIFYADHITRSMQAAIDEMSRRREIQLAYNREHNITPRSIQRAIEASMEYSKTPEFALEVMEEEETYESGKPVLELIAELEKRMFSLAKDMKFEKAAELRDRIKHLREKDLNIIL
jgi:excinuclease ABC subunit B